MVSTHLKELCKVALQNELPSKRHRLLKSAWVVDSEGNLTRNVGNYGFCNQQIVESIAAIHVLQAYKNICNGMSWDCACIVYDLDREQVAAIVAHFHKT